MIWGNFSAEEFECKHCGKNKISYAFIDKLQSLRDECKFPFIITSGYRCKDHPVEKTKSKPGTHTEGIAADILVSGSQAYKLVSCAHKHGFTGIGVKQKGNERFIHLDSKEHSEEKTRPYIWSY